MSGLGRDRVASPWERSAPLSQSPDNAGPGPEGEERAALPQITTVLDSRLEEAFGQACDPGIQLVPDGEATPSAGLAESRIHALERRGKHSRYELQDEIGRGGMGIVLRVFDVELRRKIAMKVMRRRPPADGAATGRPTRPEELMRFLEEAQVTGQLNHPGVIPVHEVGIDPSGRVYFTMRLVRGQELRLTFKNAREERAGWTLPRAVGVLVKVCETMAYAHDHGVIHRDLKPANVMVGNYGEAYVMDWGLAKVLAGRRTSAARSEPPRVTTDRSEARKTSPGETHVTEDGAVVGTPAYMAPEQASGNLDSLGPRSDVYAVGAMLYALLGGSPPYMEGREPDSWNDVLDRVLAGPPAPVRLSLAGDSARLVAICERAMQRDPEDRYQTMREMAEDLQAWLEGRVVRAYSRSPVRTPPGWLEKNRAVVALTLGALLLTTLGLLGVARLWGGTRIERDRAMEEGEALRTELSALVSLEEEARDAKEQAGLEASELQRIVGMYETLLASLPTAEGESSSALLSREADRIRSQTEGETAARGRLLTGLADLAHGLGNTAEEGVFLAEALEARRAALGDRSRETLALIERLARWHLAAGDLRLAEDLVLELMVRTPPDDPERGGRSELEAALRAALEEQ